MKCTYVDFALSGIASSRLNSA